MYVTALSWSIILIGALLVLFGIQRGQKLGFVRAAMQLSIIVVSAVISTFMSDWLSAIFEGAAYGIIYDLGITSAFEGTIGDVSYLVDLISEPIAAIMLYVPMFFALFGLFTLIAKAVYDKYVVKSNTNRGDYSDENAPYYVRESKQLGMVCGIVSGLVITTVVFSPLAGALKTGEQIVDLPEEVIGELPDSFDSYTIQRYSNDLMVSAVYSMGGRTIFDMTAKLKSSKGRVSLSDELEHLDSVGGEFITKFYSDLSELDADSIEEIIEYSGESVITEALVYCTFRNACGAWRNGNSYYGVPSPIGQAGEPFYNVIYHVLDVCNRSNIRTFYANMATAISIIGQVEEARADLTGNDYYSRLQLLCNEELIDAIEDEIDKNDNMNVAVVDPSAVISIIANELIYPQNGYRDNSIMFSEIADAMMNTYSSYGEERIAFLSLRLESIFSNHDMPLPNRAVELLSEQLHNQFSYMYVNSYDISNFFYNYVYIFYNFEVK